MTASAVALEPPPPGTVAVRGVPLDENAFFGGGLALAPYSRTGFKLTSR